jgi:hypothetical protein
MLLANKKSSLGGFSDLLLINLAKILRQSPPGASAAQGKCKVFVINSTI